MRIEQLRYLSDIQYTHSITKTAARFYISQQSLSNNLKQLEVELDMPLLERSTSGVKLTDEAMDLLAISDHFLASYDKFVED